MRDLYVNEGYLIVKCCRCGSESQLRISGFRGDFSLCPVCLDGEVECKAIQCTIQMYQENGEVFQNLTPYLAKLIRFSLN